VRPSHAIVLLLLCSAAQPPETARLEFDRGMRYYDLGEFALALEHFRASYRAQPHPDLLFNMAQCYRNLGNNERAIFFFERYVEHLPSGADAAEVDSLLVELKDRKLVVYEPPPLTATVGKSTYDLSLPSDTTVREELPLVEKWWFWAAIFGAATVAAGSAVLIAALTSRYAPPICAA
jgi:tetratricopeptide (TPR) repeat protein